MVSTITGTLSTPVRLGAGGYASSLTIKGTIHALGPAGTYAAGAFTEPYYAAVFAPAGGDESLVNLGLIIAATESTKGDNEHYGIVLGGADTISNAGTVTGVGGIAALGTAAAYVQNSGLIVGSYYGVLLTSPGTTLQNTGSILGDETGLVLFGGGVVTNDAGGYIFSAMGPGIDARGADTVENAGMISGGNGVDLLSAQGADDNNGIITATGAAPGGGYAAIQTYAGGTVRNSDILRGQNGVVLQGSGSQSAYFYNGGDIIVESAHFLDFSISGLGVLNYGAGVALDMTGTIVNPGFIYGRNAGILTQKSAAVTIVNSQMVYSQILGVDLLLGGTVVNSGTIAGSVDAIDSAGSLDLMIAQGAIFFGGVTVATGDGSLALTSASAAGSLDLGGSFSGFDAISFAPGAVWTLEGNASELAAGQTIFGFSAGDTLFLDGFSASSSQFDAASGLVLSNATASETLALNALPGDASFSVHSSTAGTEIAPVETFTNAATITVTIGTATYPSPFTIPSTGVIAPSDGSTYGFTGVVALAGAYVLNQGTVIGGPGSTSFQNFGEGGAAAGTGGTGIYLDSGASLNNQGSIIGGQGGAADGLESFGGKGGAGVTVSAGAILTNTGTIIGGAGGTMVGGDGTGDPGAGIIVSGGTVFNAGAIASGPSSFGVTFYGAVLNAGGVLFNTGTIEIPAETPLPGGPYPGFQEAGVRIEGGTLFNSGSISGYDAVLFNGAGTLELSPGAVTTGTVAADPSFADTLILTSSASSGTLDMGTSFTGLSTISFAPGAVWTLEGASIALAVGQTITGLVPGDTLILDGFSATAYSFVVGTGLTLSNATASETLAIAGSYSTASFTVTENPDGGTDVSVACFCRGTRIATPRGNTRIEKLRIGDLVNTMLGPRPIRWIGRRAYAARFLALGGRPIRIRRHAVAFNVPSRDLYVSPDHAIAEGGVLIHAHLLQNGVSITQPEITGDVEYFHLELDTPSLIFAENLATESFIDEGARHRFANAHTAPETAPQNPCLPRVFDGFHLHNIKTRIARRAGVPEPVMLGTLRGCIDESTPKLFRGWAQDSSNPEAPVLLEIFSGNSRHPKTPEIFSTLVLANAYRPDLRAAGIGSGCHGFAVTLRAPVLAVRRAADGAMLAEPPVMSLARAK